MGKFEWFKRHKRIVIFILIAAVSAAGLFAAGEYLNAGEDPDGVLVTVYKSELLANAASPPVPVFANPAGVTVDIVGGIDRAFGQGAVPQRAYNRLRLTVKNEITFTGSVNPCTGPGLITETMLIDDTKAAGAQVPLVFATARDGGGSGWTANGTDANPFLMQNPIEVNAGQNTRVELRFETAGSLNCVSSAVKLFPPAMTVLHRVVRPATCNVDGDWWFMHYTVRGDLINSTTGGLIPPTPDNIFRSTEVVSGWGSVNFNNSTKRWRVFPGHIYNSPYYPAPGDIANIPGMAEHRHNLASWEPDRDGNSFMDEGYLNPSAPELPAIGFANIPFGGPYEVTGRKVQMYFQEGGYIDGSITPDCKTFAGVNISGTESDIVVAVKKRADVATQPLTDIFNAGEKLVVLQPAFQALYNAASAPIANSTTGFWFSNSFTVIDTSQDSMFHWHNMALFLSAGDVFDPLFTGLWLSKGPEERAEMETGAISAATVRQDGLLLPEGDSFIALGQNGIGVIAGITSEVDPGWNAHRMNGGMILPVDETSTMADLSGAWNVSVLEGDVGDWSPPWFDGSEILWYGVSTGVVNINDQGDVTGDLVFKNALTGEVEINTVNSRLYGPVDECYYINNAVSPDGSDLNDPACGGITIPVYLANDVDPLTSAEDPYPSTKLTLDKNRQVLSVWSAKDMSGTIYNAPDSCDQTLNGPRTGCGDASPRGMFGVGIRR